MSPSYYGNFYSDGNKVYYWGRGGTKVFDLKEQKEDVVADGASMGVEPGSKKALFFKKNALYVTDIPLGKADLSDPVNLSNMKITVDIRRNGHRFSMRHGGPSVTVSIWRICTG